jgi:hypothetical protein
MNNLEDLLANEIERQGFRVTPDAFRHLLTECIGRVTRDGLIKVPFTDSETGFGGMSFQHFVEMHRRNSPTSFTPIVNQDASQPKEPRKPTGNLTTDMKLEIADTRSQSLPSDWNAVRSRHTGLTAQMMDEIATARQR